jgi:hypothetical protein
MKQSEAAQFLPLLKAWSEGKTLQYKCGCEWYEPHDMLDFNLPISQYRIKPEPREWVVPVRDGCIYYPKGFADSYGVESVRVREVLE